MIPKYVNTFDIKHPLTMVVACNEVELSYIISWCETKDISPPWLGKRDNFPIALSVNGGGWTNHMDRALYYVRFKDFIYSLERSIMLTINQVIDMAKEYYKNGSSMGGHLHIVLEDDNIEDNHILYCKDQAIKHMDNDAVNLADAIMKLTIKQRKELVGRHQEYFDW